RAPSSLGLQLGIAHLLSPASPTCALPAPDHGYLARRNAPGAPRRCCCCHSMAPQAAGTNARLRCCAATAHSTPRGRG
ncbi:hypothetical protein C8J57DRAFT_1381307, partial [Mycena rebaudengoi]